MELQFGLQSKTAVQSLTNGSDLEATAERRETNLQPGPQQAGLLLKQVKNQYSNRI